MGLFPPAEVKLAELELIVLAAAEGKKQPEIAAVLAVVIADRLLLQKERIQRRTRRK